MSDHLRPLRLGLVGAGGFAAFVAGVIAGLPELELVAVVDADPDRAAGFARDHGGVAVPDVEALLARDDVDAVMVATPPSTHAPLACRALAAGKHVFSEKPAAVSDDQLAALTTAVADAGRAYVVDHVIHYNPLVSLLARLRRDGVVGPAQRFAFDNDAGDTDLVPGHWFWDADVSGGILLEHAVHFLDVAHVLVGSPATQAQAMATTRPDGSTDQVVATVRHANGALATHAHGFCHDNVAERQHMRVDLGTAEARLTGWIPLSLELDAWVDDDGARALQAIADDPTAALATPGFRPHPHQTARLDLRRDAVDRDLSSRGTVLHRRHHALLQVQLGEPEDKQEVYVESVRAALTDFVTAARTASTPSAGIGMAIASVATATAATRAIATGGTEPVVTPR